MRTRWLILLRSAVATLFVPAFFAMALAACEEPGAPAGSVSSALDGGVVPPCTDGDGDGFGPGCAAGLDCDDADPASTNECRNCATPDTGCACDGSVPEQTCYLDPVDVDGVAMCHSGTRFCRDGAWTSCLQLERFPLPGNRSGASSAALVTGPVPCNLCNPSCFSTTDTPGPGDDTLYGTGVVYGSSPAGITLGSSTPMTTLTDSDGDGVPDLYDSADFDPAITGFEGGIFRLLPFGSTALAPLLLNVQVRTADIYFLMDTTGSMGGEISNLKSSLNTTVIPAIRTSIPDAWFGVGRHDDYPINPYGDLGSGDIVFANVLDITDPLSGSGAITAAVSSLNTHYGTDWPESQTQALWGVATGDALGRFSYARTCSGGRFGAPCFRAGTVPIVVLLTDAPFHNGPNTAYNYNNSLFAGTYTVYFPMPPATPILGTGGLAPATPAVPIAPIGGGIVPLPAATPIGGGPTTLPNEGLTAAPSVGGSFLTLPSPTPVVGPPVLALRPDPPSTAPALADAYLTVPATTPVPTTSVPAPDGTVAPVPSSADAWVPLPGPTYTRGNAYDLPDGTPLAAPASAGAWASLPATTQVPGTEAPLPGSSPVAIPDGPGTYATLPATSNIPTTPTLVPAATSVTPITNAALPFPSSATAITSATSPSIAVGGNGDLGDVTNDSKRVSGSTMGGTVVDTDCADDRGGRAVFFRFTLTRPRTVIIETRAPASTPIIDTYLHLYNTNITPSLTSPNSNRRTCDDDGAGSPYSRITEFLPAGTHYVMLNRYCETNSCRNGSGNYQLQITPEIANERATDRIRAMGDLTSQTTGLAFSGNTAPMTNDHTPVASCSSAASTGDAVFSFQISQQTRLQFDTSGSSNDTVIYLLDALGNPVVGGCSDSSTSSTGGDVLDVTLTPTPLGALNTYYVVVDGKGMSGGAYQLNVRRIAPLATNDTWGTALDLGNLTNTAASRRGATDLLHVSDDFANGCSFAGASRDLMFRFELTAPRQMRISTTGTNFDNVLYLRRDPATPRSSQEVGCANSNSSTGGETLTTAVLPIGFYYVAVDGTSTNVGDFTLNIEPLIPGPQTNENFTSDLEIGELTTRTTAASYTGFTGNMTSDFSSGSGCNAGAGGDAVFSFDLASRTRVILDTSGSGFDTSMGLYNAISYVTCNDDSALGGTTTSRLDVTLDPGRYFVVVDGKGTASGNYRLNVTPVLIRSQSNERHAQGGTATDNALDLGDLTDSAASRNGFTCDMVAHHSETLGDCTGAGTGAGQDSVFKFSLTAPRRVRIRVPTTGFDHAVYLRRVSTASSFSTLYCVNASGTTGAEEIDTNTTLLDPGTYHVVVDGESSSACGNYKLDIQPFLPGAGTNENLATALPIGVLTTRSTSAQYFGRTTGMVSDYGGSCGAGAAGDAVFSFTLAVGTQVTIDTAGSNFNTSVALLNAGGSLLTCDDDGGPSGTSRIVTTLAAGTYYVVVDGNGGATGDYRLRIDPTLVDSFDNDRFASFDDLGNLTNGSVKRVGSTNTSAINNDYNLSCDGSRSDLDAVFRFTLSEMRQVRIDTIGSSFDTVLVLQGPSATVPTAVSELQCNDDASGTASVIERTLAAGNYYVILDGYRNNWWETSNTDEQRGNYVLNVQSFAPGKNTNETQDTALDVMRVDNRTTAASYTGNTGPMTNDITSSSCGSSAAGDAVFVFRLLSPARVLLDTIGSSFNTTLTLRDSSFAPIGCAASGTGSSIDTGTALAAGTYYAVVDGATGGAYRFNIRPYVTRAANEQYASALDLGDVANTAHSRGGSTCAMDNHYADGCAAGAAGDAVFAFSVSTARRVRLDTGGSDFDTSLSLRSGTAPTPATMVDCNDDSAALGVRSRLEVDLMPGVTYFAVVDGKGAACGAYRFNITPLAPGRNTNENQATAAPIVWASNGAASYVGNTTGMANDVPVSSCGDGTAPDAVFSFVLPVSTQVRINTNDSAIDTIVTLRDSSFAEIACATGTAPAGAVIPDTPLIGGVTYYVVIEGRGGAAGAYRMAVRPYLPGPPANESFATAYAIPGDLSITSASFTSDTALMGDQHSSPKCGGAGVGAKDAVYSFSLSAPTRLKIDTQGSTGLTNSVISVWTKPASGPEVEVYCNDDAPGLGTLSLVDPAPFLLPAGDYYVVVDGLNSSFAGAYRLNLTPFQFGAGSNENAATAADVGDMTIRPTSVSYVGNTASPAMVSDSTDACGGGAAGDAYFRFSLSGPTRIIADTLGSTFDTTLRLTSAAEVELNCNDNDAALPTSRIDTMLPPGTYYLIVDGQGTAAGRYQFNLTRFLPGTATNETIATAHDLSDITNGAASRTGNTCGLVSDYEGSCNAGTAGDAAFRFVLSAPRRVLISTAGSGFDTSMALWTGTTPATATYVNCNDDAAGLSTSVLDLTLAAGTYYVVVDGFGTECGDYKFNVQTYIPGAMLNETYASAQSAGELSTRTTGVTYTGNTTSMVDHYSGTCGAGTAPDAVFSFTLASSTRVRIDTTGSAFNTSISLRNNLYAEVTCNATGTASVIDQTLTPGTYFVIVDGAGTANGNYQINFTPYLPAPNTNETFGTAYAIGDLTTRSAAFTSSTTGMVNHYSSTAAAASNNGCSAGAAADAVFSFTLTATKDVIIDTVGSSFDTSLSLWNSAFTRLNCDDNGAGTQSRIVRTGLAAGTYYVIVDGKAAGSGGAYNLNIRVSNGTASGYTPPTWAQTVSQLNSRGIKVIVVESSGGNATARNDANAVCTATATTDASGAPLRYSIASDGTGLGATIATAIANLANYSRLDITARANDNPTTVFDERTLVASILAVAGSYAPGRCTGITGGVQFNQCLPGTMVQFQVNFTGVVMPTSMPQRFDFTIDTLGNGTSVMSTTPVTIVIPPMAPLFPSSGTYARDFDATTRCAGTEVPRWSNLSWTATLPAGTSIDFVLRAANTSAGLATATPVTVSTPTLSSPQNIGDRLVAGGLPATLPYLRVTAVLRSNTTGTVAPTLSSFNVLYDCVAGE
jgi:hypothetical protein